MQKKQNKTEKKTPHKKNYQTQQLAQNLKLLFLSVTKNILEPFPPVPLEVRSEVLTDRKANVCMDCTQGWALLSRSDHLNLLSTGIVIDTGHSSLLLKEVLFWTCPQTETYPQSSPGTGHTMYYTALGLAGREFLSL